MCTGFHEWRIHGSVPHHVEVTRGRLPSGTHQ